MASAIFAPGTDMSRSEAEFTAALTEVLAENAVGHARRGRLARARQPSRSTPNTTNMNIFWRWELHLNYPCFVARLGGVSGGKETQG
jgi:hypothetical protein